MLLQSCCYVIETVLRTCCMRGLIAQGLFPATGCMLLQQLRCAQQRHARDVGPPEILRIDGKHGCRELRHVSHQPLSGPACRQ
jgi:hypothetical protein